MKNETPKDVLSKKEMWAVNSVFKMLPETHIMYQGAWACCCHSSSEAAFDGLYSWFLASQV